MSNIHGLDSMNSDGNSSDGSEKNKKKDDRQGFYVGGSTNSGQEVLGPPGHNNAAFTDRLFAAVRSAGAEEIAADSSAIAPTAQTGRVTVFFNIWNNGFSVGDGPLRTSDDPQNRDFMEAIVSGRVPNELAAIHPGEEIDLRFVRKDSDFVPPKQKPFSGLGRKLGSL